MNGARSRPRKAPREVGPAPTQAVLHEAALASITRSAGTAATLRRALDRKIAAWARQAQKTRDAELVTSDVETCRQLVETIIARFREVGLVNDQAFAESRARGLSRSGRSRRAISAHLAAKGVAPETAKSAISTDATIELAAALTFARKKRIGPYAREEIVERKEKQKALAAMARAGFDWSTCERAMRMEREAADEYIVEHRSD